MGDFDVNGFGDYIKTLAEKAVNKQLDVVIPKVWKQAKDKYDEMYKNAVEDWYGGYSQKVYSRTGKLKELIKTEVIGSGKNSALKYDFDTYPGRTGTDITDIILIQGFHGGPSIPFSIEPDRHIIYNGSPEPYTNDIYYKWYPATASTSPYDLFMKEKEKFDNTELDNIFNDLWQVHASMITL